ncbi:Pyrroline-5-carboxylate reductase [Corynebacterium capitovis DSM 44611]|nr:pyrroline-5-carboxylate reductase [Corynebacterium capitovis]WKD56775.1 Pyrroline-5-carboxylate reductase [Corynebacterium capitovis DSM 44611]
MTTETQPSDIKIAVIGAGTIGEALIAGLINAGVSPRSIRATNRRGERGAELAQRYGIIATTDNNEAVSDADVCFLCVKPNQVVDVISGINKTVAKNDASTVLVSMAAGVTLSAMEDAVCAVGTALARVMPNTPMLVGRGVHVVSYGRYVTDEQQQRVHGLLAATGRVVVVEEKLIDKATALSGSGPAYFFLIAEALIDAGVALGLPGSVATELATATAAGAGEMLLGEAGPVGLRRAVTSPGGATAAAIRELEESGVRGALYRATEACAERARELGA